MAEILKSTDPDNWQRYHFMLSSFSRIYGVEKINEEIKKFCHENLEKQIEPHILYDLTLYDKYINEQFYNWKRA